MFPKIGVPQNGWFIMENPIKMNDLGAPLFLETPNKWAAFRKMGASIWMKLPLVPVSVLAIRTWQTCK